MIGTILGSRYELLEKIGEGGMAIVYKAKCRLLNRYVAVKILKEEFSNNIDFMDKFKKEASSVASLSSNNIVNIYDVGQERDINYIVMEYIKGKTLKEIILENGSMNYDQIIDYGMQIAKALECAHKNNIIHRDIKPHNILVTEDGTVKVTDFGIAKAASSVTITNTSTVMGSAHYFSPEQAKASFVDCRTDIYSFGIVLYEMSTGQVPYDAESPVSVALKHIQEQVVPPKKINGNVPENLNKLILKAIEKEPIKRYQTANEMFLDLQRIQKNSSYTIATNSMENEYTRVMAAVNVDDYEKEDDHEEEKEEVVEKEQVIKKPKSKNNKKNKTIIMAFVAVILLIVLGSVAGVTLKNYLTDKQVNVADKILVPKIIGLDKVEAEKLVVEKGLNFVVAGEENSEKPEGEVLLCFPDEGTELKAKGEVRVTVSKGPASFKIPSVKGTDKASATAIIEQNGLVLGNVTSEFNDSIASGLVISQNPDPGSLVQKGDKVDLVISKGVEIKLTKVPNLNDVSLNDAERVLQNANLKLGERHPVVTHDKSLDGKIFNQSIAANTEVTEGNSVGVNYYKYEEPKKEQFDVPDFKGKTVKAARESAAQSNINIVVSGNDEDIIESQDKEPGTKANVGDTITLTSKAAEVPVTPETPPATTETPPATTETPPATPQ
ncbi:Stk1 family PASTA domain-containing Ser/Thr kinase [Clostridium sp. CM027]|uniref:Stk1 family PASTA domain-containing Ser/Thr kinase n=1 Tax=Clostridium sp. CM027 TaxID=2849865 RepID=UPI001C6E8E6D|nr:Stk1 family PASTA domain-containing Ser/Thr kinase [Clostridium sp. CM027]MBW9144135.1 Stk1 family PASTA domain-containing Ser/Thr kinase [Clostridium sp. CM027]UVE41222.1 Stk1 family PASTA domain-containing Ser/Thr kinase [Clostridium sp. CM027]